MKQFKGYLVSLLITIFLSFSSTFAADVFYVSTSGSDSNSGTQNAPFATIQKAADAAKAGDTVKVLAGIYVPQNTSPNSGMIIFRHSGAPDKPITFEAVGEVKVVGDRGVYKFGGIFEINAEQTDSPFIHDIIVRGFRLENSSWFGIRLNRAQNIVLENNYTYNTGGSGIQASSSNNITVRGNTLEKACISPDKKIDTQEIISLSDVDNFEIDHNHISNGGIVNGGNGGEGIDTKTGTRNGSVHHNIVHDLVRLGIYVDSWDRIVENISVYSNTVYNCAAGIALSSENGGTVRQIKVFNNVLYNNEYSGVIVSAWVANGPRQDISIVNNTIFHNGFHKNGKNDWGGGITVETANISNLILRNNIVSQNNTWQISATKQAAQITIDYNLLDGFRGYADDKLQEQQGKNFFVGDPRFVDAKAGNFHLKKTSSAIDHGSFSLAPDKDFDLISRPQGIAVDLGAFEINNNVTNK